MIYSWLYSCHLVFEELLAYKQSYPISLFKTIINSRKIAKIGIYLKFLCFFFKKKNIFWHKYMYVTRYKISWIVLNRRSALVLLKLTLAVTIILQQIHTYTIPVFTVMFELKKNVGRKSNSKVKKLIKQPKKTKSSMLHSHSKYIIVI